MPAVRELRFLGCCRALSPGRISECGDEGDSWSIMRGPGDCESEPALKGWKDIEGRLLEPSPVRATGLEAVARPEAGRERGGSGMACVGSDGGGESVSDPGGFTDRSADIGLVPM
jgi:hypothetical protein